MVIPQGKKFKIRGFSTGTDADGKTVSIPKKGYKGNAFIGQDVNLNIVNNYTKPLEGLLDRVPHIADMAMRAKGVSLKNHRFTSMKYWTGSEPMDLDFQFVFETQTDSYYDVYRPVVDLLDLAAPGESDTGFYIPPVPTLKLIAKEGLRFVKSLPKVGGGAVGKGIGATIDAVAGGMKTIDDNLAGPGYQIDLFIGGVFKFQSILIKNVTPTFSSELAYAPIRAINLIKAARADSPNLDLFNPYNKSEREVKLLSQTVCALLAFAKAGLGAAPPVPLPQFLRNAAEAIKVLPAFPIRAEVNMSLELQFPMTKGKPSRAGIKKSVTDVDSIFPDSAYNAGYWQDTPEGGRDIPPEGFTDPGDLIDY